MLIRDVDKGEVLVEETKGVWWAVVGGYSGYLDLSFEKRKIMVYPLDAEKSKHTLLLDKYYFCVNNQ